MTDAFRGYVRVSSPPGLNFGPVGSWNVPATEDEIRALREGPADDRAAAEAALCSRLWDAYAHVLMYGAPDAEPVGVFP